MRIKPALAALVLAAFAVSCDQSAPTEVLSEQALSEQDVAASHGQPGQVVPLVLKGTGVVTNWVFAPGFPAHSRVDFDGRCSVLSDWVIEFLASGQGTQIGNFTMIIEHCSQFDFSTGEGTYGDGTLIITAANGDELWGTYLGTAVPLSPTENWFQNTYVIDGGTGRFANASSSGVQWGTTLSGTLDITEFTMEGMITYDASDRRAD